MKFSRERILYYIVTISPGHEVSGVRFLQQLPVGGGVRKRKNESGHKFRNLVTKK